MKVGIIGCGKISTAYLNHAPRFPSIEVCAVADLRLEAAQARAQEHGVEAMTVEELLSHPEIGAVVNLTIPAAHLDVGMAALEAGKHVYSEKPLVLEVQDAQSLLKRAAELGLSVGCAPDTFLGAGQQTARRVVDEGAIGRPLSGIAVMLSGGPERFHPNPAFFYLRGGGPLFDMGPYYVATLVNMLGPVASVVGTATRGFNERICKNEAIKGQKLPVEVFTHYSGVLEFCSGTTISIVFSFDVQAHRHNLIELYGSEGSLIIPDPNTFGGKVELFRSSTQDWEEVQHTHPHSENSRIIGLVDMLDAVKEGRTPRCSGELALHVLEVMHAVETSAMEGRRVEVSSRPAKPDPMPSL